MRTEHRSRSVLGLGPLEDAIMQAVWEADDWLMVRDIRDRMDYERVAYTTVATVAGVLCEKDLLVRRQERREGIPGSAAWWYRATRPMAEHVGDLIAKLLDRSPSPEATLSYALTTTRSLPGQRLLHPGQQEHAGTRRDVPGRPGPVRERPAAST